MDKLNGTNSIEIYNLSIDTPLDTQLAINLLGNNTVLYRKMLQRLEHLMIQPSMLELKNAVETKNGALLNATAV